MSTSIGADRSRAQGLVGNPAKGIRTGLFLLCMLAVIGTLGIGTLHAQTDEGGLQKPAAEAKPSPVEPGHKLATEAIPAKPMTHLYARNPLLTGEKTRSEVWGLGEHFGVESNPTGDPIGGGEGYSRMVTNRDYTVKTKEEFLAALEKAKAGQVVYVDDEAEIDLTGHANVVIPGAVTLASGRGRNGSKGGLISTTGPDLPPRGTLWLSVAHPLLTAGGRKVRVTGIRLQGPSTKPTKHSRAWGILCRDHEGFEVDNCEMLGWTHAAIRISKAKNAYIHHNYIHHCQLNGLGYGVSLEPPVNPLIMANKFDWVRHCIASGQAFTGR